MKGSQRCTCFATLKAQWYGSAGVSASACFFNSIMPQVFRDIFPKTTLPDGRKVHTFYQDKMAKASLRVDISPPSPPSDLNDMFHSGGLPAPPEPPAPQPLHIKIGRFESVLKLPPPIPPVPEVLNHECPGSTCTCKGCRVSKRSVECWN